MQSFEEKLLILFKGYPGTGKSYFSKELSRYLNSPLLVRDKYKTLLYKHNYSEKEIGRKSYEMMWRLADKYLTQGNICICDTSLVQPTGIQDIENLRKKFNARILIIECFCRDKNIHQSRLQKRKLFPDYYGINSIEKYKAFIDANKKYDTFSFPYPTIQVDTSLDIDIESFVKTYTQFFN